MDFSNKTAYITGGSKGIGLAIAHALVDNGFRVAITGRNAASLESVISSFGNPEKVLGITANAGVFSEEQAAVEKTISHFGGIDVVIANAGVGNFGAIDDLSIEAWDEMIQTNLSGAFYSLKASLEALKKSEGYYISIASLAGCNFFAKGSGYNASKFGLVGFTQAAMLDLRPHNIKATTIMPGSVSTYFNGNEPSDKDAWKIQPEDIGKLVIDLLTMHPRTLPSKIEVRPTRPDLKTNKKLFRERVTRFYF